MSDLFFPANHMVQMDGALYDCYATETPVKGNLTVDLLTSEQSYLMVFFPWIKIFEKAKSLAKIKIYGG